MSGLCAECDCHATQTRPGCKITKAVYRLERKTVKQHTFGTSKSAFQTHLQNMVRNGLGLGAYSPGCKITKAVYRLARNSVKQHTFGTSRSAFQTHLQNIVRNGLGGWVHIVVNACVVFSITIDETPLRG